VGAYRFDQQRGKGMLSLTRSPNQSLYIGDDVVITIIQITKEHIKLCVNAPDGTLISGAISIDGSFVSIPLDNFELTDTSS
jgi:hypothetical protein